MTKEEKARELYEKIIKNMAGAGLPSHYLADVERLYELALGQVVQPGQSGVLITPES